MTRNLLIATVVTLCWLAGVPTNAASPTDAPGASPAAPPRFDTMRYFILDAARQAHGIRGDAYINLIGDARSRTFTVYYRGTATSLARGSNQRHLLLLLKDSGRLVGTVDLANLTEARGSVTLDRRAVPVTCTTEMRDIDEVDARIEP